MKNHLNNINSRIDNDELHFTYNYTDQMISRYRGGVVQDFSYDATGLVSTINSPDGSVDYNYDDRGFRQRTNSTFGSTNNETIYIRDASGNVLSIYKKNGSSYEQIEVPVYGATRLGRFKPGAQQSFDYELKDHLGNVRAVLSKELVTSTQTFSNTTTNCYAGNHENFTSFTDVMEGDLINVHIEAISYAYFGGSAEIIQDGPTQHYAYIDHPSWHDYTITFIAEKDGEVILRVGQDDDEKNVCFRSITATLERSALSDNYVVSQATDYWPFGMVMRSTINGQRYRYGYQGEYAEDKTDETGYNSFQLRLYDPIIGRWFAPDPYGQYPSPYLAMGNNPVSRVDPDGGFDWYTDTDGNLHYDKNVTSQADVDALGGGQYIDESFSDGINAYMPGGGIMNLETGQFSPTNFVASFTEPLYGRSSIEGYDYVAAVTTLNSNAKSSPVGYCAKYVRLALEGGGLSTSGRPGSAKDYDLFYQVRV